MKARECTVIYQYNMERAIRETVFMYLTNKDVFGLDLRSDHVLTMQRTDTRKVHDTGDNFVFHLFILCFLRPS